MNLPKPSDVNTDGHLFDTFGNCETEISARWIIRYLQEVERETGECWAPFTIDEIEEFYSRSGEYSGFHFNRLLGWDQHTPGISTEYLKVTDVDEGYQIRVTLKFVAAVEKYIK